MSRVEARKRLVEVVISTSASCVAGFETWLIESAGAGLVLGIGRNSNWKMNAPSTTWSL